MREAGGHISDQRLKEGSASHRSETDELVSKKVAEADRVLGAVEAARSLPSDLYLSSLVGYATGFWPLVKDSVKELQTLWRWELRNLAGPSLECASPKLTYRLRVEF